MKFFQIATSIALVLLVIFAIVKEAEMLGTHRIGILPQLPMPYEKTKSHNQMIDEAEAIPPRNFEDVFQIFNHTKYWRRCLVLSVLIVLFFHMAYSPTIEWDSNRFIISVLLAGICLYLSFNFYKFHYIEPYAEYLDRNYQVVRVRSSA